MMKRCVKKKLKMFQDIKEFLVVREHTFKIDKIVKIVHLSPPLASS